MAWDSENGQTLQDDLLQGIADSEQAAMEWATYQRELPRLMSEGHAEQFVAVFGDKIADPAPTWRAAVESGLKAFHTRSVMLLQIGIAEEREVPIARLSLPG